MDRQDNMPSQGRRAASRATKLRKRKQRMNALLLIGAIAAVLWLVFVLPVWLGLPSPFTELRRASRTVGTDSGEVEGSAELTTGYEGLRISEIMPSNKSSVTDETGGYPDWIEIWNSSNHEINLKGVGLSDDGTSVKFLFPAVSLAADGAEDFPAVLPMPEALAFSVCTSEGADTGAETASASGADASGAAAFSFTE